MIKQKLITFERIIKREEEKKRIINTINSQKALLVVAFALPFMTVYNSISLTIFRGGILTFRTRGMDVRLGQSDFLNFERRRNDAGREGKNIDVVIDEYSFMPFSMYMLKHKDLKSREMSK
ncbi:unnamed protein product [Dovyalis caffra]|uniref:Uncharacterized protein n=1 Tax=Dovyalis caffra TaxID=77055 RepID=A0AAV1QNK1_9ROSI|nr:unnamed protein product [Dovyalis caffra]